MTTILKLKADQRENAGKRYAKAVRYDARVPVIVYGGKKEALMLSLDTKEITKLYVSPGFMSHLLDLEVNKKSVRVIPKHVQLHPVTDKILHIDFMYVSDKDKIKVKVPISIANRDKCVGLKKGGLLNIIRHDIELFAQANSIPDKIEIDIANLEIGHNVHLSNLELPKDCVSATEEDITIMTISGRGGAKDSDDEDKKPEEAGK